MTVDISQDIKARWVSIKVCADIKNGTGAVMDPFVF